MSVNAGARALSDAPRFVLKKPDNGTHQRHTFSTGCIPSIFRVLLLFSRFHYRQQFNSSTSSKSGVTSFTFASLRSPFAITFKPTVGQSVSFGRTTFRLLSHCGPNRRLLLLWSSENPLNPLKSSDDFNPSSARSLPRRYTRKGQKSVGRSLLDTFVRSHAPFHSKFVFFCSINASDRVYLNDHF
jgi:hypothetical protein